MLQHIEMEFKVGKRRFGERGLKLAKVYNKVVNSLKYNITSKGHLRFY